MRIESNGEQIEIDLSDLEEANTPDPPIRAPHDLVTLDEILGSHVGQESLQEARREFQKELSQEEESVCPCCRSQHRYYHRKLNSGMIRCLAWLARVTEVGTYIHVADNAPRSVMKSSEVSKLRYWGLIVGKPETEDSKWSGYWGITQKGLTFVNDGLAIEDTIILYSGSLVGRGTDMVTYDDCVEDHFDLDELLEAGDM